MVKLENLNFLVGFDLRRRMPLSYHELRTHEHFSTKTGAFFEKMSGGPFIKRFSYLVMFIVKVHGESSISVNMKKTILQTDTKRKHALNNPTTKCTYLYGNNHN